MIGVSSNWRVFLAPRIVSCLIGVLEMAVCVVGIVKERQNFALRAGSSKQGKARLASVASNWVAPITVYLFIS
jgi:hypothetical protein